MRFVLLLACLSVAQAQPPTFDVVSIKLAQPETGSSVGSSGGPGTRRPGVWTCQNMSLHNIVWIAFDLQPYQLQAPDWMHEPRFDITAKVPEGATRAQFHVMFQNMLVERFGLKFHRSQREVQGYELTVAKGGPKFKESGPPPPPDAPRPVIQRPTLAADGYPTVTPGISGPNTIGNRARGQWLRAGMERLIRDLNYEVGKPIVDATSLTGMYDLALFWVRDPDRPDSTGPALFGALQDQLGLKLESKKVTIPIVVVDHAEKLPTEN